MKKILLPMKSLGLQMNTTEKQIEKKGVKEKRSMFEQK